jgi:hypothetical protein
LVTELIISAFRNGHHNRVAQILVAFDMRPNSYFVDNPGNLKFQIRLFVGGGAVGCRRKPKGLFSRAVLRLGADQFDSFF